MPLIRNPRRGSWGTRRLGGTTERVPGCEDPYSPPVPRFGAILMKIPVAFFSVGPCVPFRSESILKLPNVTMQVSLGTSVERALGQSPGPQGQEEALMGHRKFCFICEYGGRMCTHVNPGPCIVCRGLWPCFCVNIVRPAGKGQCPLCPFPGQHCAGWWQGSSAPVPQ